MKKNWLYVLVFLSVSSLAWGGARETALEKELQGDRAGAVASYEEWLAAYPQSAEFTGILFHAADIHPSLNGGIELLEKYLALAPDRAAQSAIVGKTATLYEVSGDIVKAQTLFEQAYQLNPSEAAFPFLYRAARLCFELGETHRSEELARFVTSHCTDAATRKRAAFLLTRILASSGNLEEALRISLRLTEDAGNPAGNGGIDNTDVFPFFLYIFNNRLFGGAFC